MALFPKDDLLVKEIDAWKSFADGLRVDDQKIFQQMLNQCYKYLRAINAKGEAFPTESIMMALILSQQQMIEFLLEKIKNK
jgi:hypothetical protein